MKWSCRKLRVINPNLLKHLSQLSHKKPRWFNCHTKIRHCRYVNTKSQKRHGHRSAGGGWRATYSGIKKCINVPVAGQHPTTDCRDEPLCVIYFFGARARPLFEMKVIFVSILCGTMYRTGGDCELLHFFRFSPSFWTVWDKFKFSNWEEIFFPLFLYQRI